MIRHEARALSGHVGFAACVAADTVGPWQAADRVVEADVGVAGTARKTSATNCRIRTAGAFLESFGDARLVGLAACGVDTCDLVLGTTETYGAVETCFLAFAAGGEQNLLRTTDLRAACA